MDSPLTLQEFFSIMTSNTEQGTMEQTNRKKKATHSLPTLKPN